MQKSTTFFNNDFLYELVLEIMTSLVLFAKKCVKPRISLKGKKWKNKRQEVIFKQKSTI